MSTKTALAIRHVAFEDLGTMVSAVQRAGLSVTYCDVGGAELAGVDPLEADLLVVLGGPVGVNDKIAYPFLAMEVELLRDRMAANMPTVGICLGAQLMARALGNRVYAASEKEIGWSKLKFTSDGVTSPLRHLEDIEVLHWHGDTFDLPQGARLLASTASCTNQAFSLGQRILAMQFHPEVQTSTFENWLIGHAFELADAGIDASALRRDTLLHAPALRKKAEEMFNEWLAGALA